MSEPLRSAASETWPSLPLEAWADTYATLHLWTQIVGKIRHTLSPQLAHCWSDTLYVTARGLTTSPIPFGSRVFEIDFDFIDHSLVLRTAEGAVERVPLQPQSVAAFYRLVFAALGRLHIDVRIVKKPNEVAEPVPFDEDNGMPRTTASMRTGSGACSSRRTASSRRSALGF